MMSKETDEEVILRLAQAAQAARNDPGEDLSGLSPEEFLTRLLGNPPTKICDIPFENLRIGDRVISLTGKKGFIAGLYNIGDPTPLGGIVREDSDYGPEILFLWIGSPSTWSLTGHNFLRVHYVGHAGE